MPNIKGSKFNVKTGKYEGGVKRQTAKTRKKEKQDFRGITRKNVTENTKILARQDRQDSVYMLYALYPAGRAYLAHIETPTHDYVAMTYGGGNYSVAEVDRNTGQPLGETFPLTIDRTAFPPRLPGFVPAAAPFQPFGFQGQQGFQFPGGGQGQQQQGAGPAVSELEDELDEAEKDLAQTKIELASVKRELAEVKENAAKEKAEAAMRQMQADFQNQMKELVSKLDGRKDPLEQFMAFKRMEGELSGPVIGKASGPLESLAMITQIMDFTDKLKAKAASDDTGGGGASNGFLDVFKMVAPMLQKAQDQRHAAPPPQPVVMEQSQPQPQEASPAEPALLAMIEQVRVQLAGGASPAAFVEWMKAQTGPEFDAAREIVKVDQPEGFLQLIKERVPAMADTEQKEAWILEAIKATQADLLGVA